ERSGGSETDGGEVKKRRFWPDLKKRWFVGEVKDGESEEK
ncbi:hypothetical protein A2U01_0046694, partial [Trifolium medium]|nr:hypothetical protein [Trifolium medium]